MIVPVMLMIPVGMGVYTFFYAKGSSYLSNDSSACVNCHIMQDQYDGYLAGSHSHYAGCNDCHTPPGVFRAYTTKAINGFNHSVAFTTGQFRDPVMIKDWNREITNQSCTKCHDSVFSHNVRERDCTSCHADSGHK